MTLLFIILGALLCVGLGVAIGYHHRERKDDETFQAMADQGVIVVKTEDGWMGTKRAFDEIAKEGE